MQLKCISCRFVAHIKRKYVLYEQKNEEIGEKTNRKTSTKLVCRFIFYIKHNKQTSFIIATQLLRDSGDQRKSNKHKINKNEKEQVAHMEKK